jgi:hypothetical protein
MGMGSRVRNLRRVAAALALVAVFGVSAAPAAHAGKPGTTTGSGKKWK